MNKVRTITLYKGGGFGGGGATNYDDICALLAKKAGKPVMLEYSREQDFTGTHARWSTRSASPAAVSKSDAGFLRFIFRHTATSVHTSGSCVVCPTSVAPTHTIRGMGGMLTFTEYTRTLEPPASCAHLLVRRLASPSRLWWTKLLTRWE